MAPVKVKEKPEEAAVKVAEATRELIRELSRIVPVMPLAALDKAGQEARRASRDIKERAKGLNDAMLLGSNTVDKEVAKRAFSPEERRRYGPEIRKVERLASEIETARKEGDMKTADRYAKELRSEIGAIATKEQTRKKDVSQLLNQKTTELTRSKNIREEFYGRMASTYIKEGKRKAASLAVSMGMLEQTAKATAPKEGAREYLKNYKEIHDTIAEKKPITPDRLGQFAKQIEAASTAAETRIETEKFRNAIRRWGRKLATQRLVVKGALDRVDDLAKKGEAEEAYKLLMRTSMYANSAGMLGKREKGMITSLAKEDAVHLRGMESALGAFTEGKKTVEGKAVEEAFMESYNTAQTAYATRRLKGFEKLVSKIKVGRETINAAIVEAKERIKAGEPSRALLLLEYMGHYLRNYNFITGKRAGRVPEYAKGREELLDGISGEIKAKSDAERIAAGQLFDSGTLRITGAKGLRNDLEDFQRKLKGEIPFVEGLPDTKGNVPLGEKEKDKFQSYISTHAIQLHDERVAGTKLKSYIRALGRAASRGDVEAYNKLKRAAINRMLLVAASKLKRRALTKAGVPLITRIEPMLKNLEAMYKAGPAQRLEKLYKKAYPITKDEGRPYMDVRKKFLLNATLFYQGRPKTEALPEIKPALERVASLEKRRAALVKKLRDAMKTEKKIPQSLMQEYREFLKDVNKERKTAAALDMFIKQLELNEDYHSMTGEVLGPVAGMARSELRTSRKLLEEGSIEAIRGDFKAAEAKYKDAIHKRRIALGMYSAEALKLKFKEKKLAPEYAGAPQFAFYEDMHTEIFHGTLHGFKSDKEQKAAENMVKAATSLELAYFMIPADAMSQFFSDFSGRQEDVRATVEEAAESFRAGRITEGNKMLAHATEVFEDMQKGAENNRMLSNVAVIAGGIAAGHVFGWVASGAVFTTSALDGVVTEYSIKGYASPAAWGGLAAMVAMMGLSGGAYMLRSAAEYKVGLGATRYASRLTSAARAVEYTNMALGTGFVGYMSYEATTAFMEGRIAEGLLTAGMAFYPVLHMKLAPRWETYKAQRTAKAKATAELRMILDDMTPLARPAPMPKGTWEAVELLDPRSPASLRNTLEGLTIPEKAVAGKTAAARKALAKRNAARETLESIRAEQPEVATVVEGMVKNPAIREYLKTGRLTTESETALKWAESKIEKTLPPGAVETARMEAVVKIAVGAETAPPVQSLETAAERVRPKPVERVPRRRAETIPPEVLEAVGRNEPLGDVMKALAERDPSKASVLKRRFASLIEEGHYAERFSMASTEERVIVLKEMAEGRNVAEAFDIMAQRMAPTTSDKITAFLESPVLTAEEIQSRIWAISQQDRRLGNVLTVVTNEAVPKYSRQRLIKRWVDVQEGMKRLDATNEARRARSPEDIKVDEIELIKKFAEVKKLDAAKMVEAYGEGEMKGRLDVLELLEIEAFEGERLRAEMFPESAAETGPVIQEFFDLLLRGKLESELSSLPRFEGTSIEKVEYIDGLRGIYKIGMSNGRDVFVKMEDASAAIFGRDLVTNEGLFTSRLHGRDYDTGLRITVEGREEAVKQHYTISEDMHDTVGTSQTIKVPIGKGKSRIMKRTVLGVETLGGSADSAVLRYPNAENSMHEIFYALMSIPKGRQILFRSWRAYHEISRRSLLIDRWARNTALVASGEEGMTMRKILNGLREKGPTELVNMIEKGTIELTFQPYDLDFIAGRVGPTVRRVYLTEKGEEITREEAETRKAGGEKIVEEERPGFGLREFNKDFLDATLDLMNPMPDILNEASRSVMPSGKRLYEGEGLTLKDILRDMLSEEAEGGANLGGSTSETLSAAEGIIKGHHGKPIGPGCDATGVKEPDGLKVGDYRKFGDYVLITDPYGRSTVDLPLQNDLVRLYRELSSPRAQRVFREFQESKITEEIMEAEREAESTQM